MNFLGIIPARYGSTRLPGKPLAMIGDKPMIQHVYENCLKALEHVYVATDDQRIVEAVEAFGGKAVMTSENHTSGTDRCAEAANKVIGQTGVKFDVIINIQGDEPFFDSTQLLDIMKCFDAKDTQLATLVQEVQENAHIFDDKEAKVVMNTKGEAIYFSRSPIPFVREVDENDWSAKHTFYRHMGIYGYRLDILNEVVQLPVSSLEKAESLEQLRWIENGYRVKCGITEIEETMAIDDAADLEKANELYKQSRND